MPACCQAKQEARQITSRQQSIIKGLQEELELNELD
jgi:hypothetical protein